MATETRPVRANVRRLEEHMDRLALSAVVARSGNNFTYLAGMAPGLPGVYQLNVVPQQIGTDRLFIRSQGTMSNTTSIGIRSTGRNVANVPSGVTSELQKVLRPGDRVFNAQIWGSWFELALPRNPVFVDSRIEVFPASVVSDYLAVSAGRQGWQRILQRWRVRAVAAARSQQAELIPLISHDRGWRLVYQDKDGLVFVRR